MVFEKSKKREDRGQTMVEFAMVLPVVLVLMFGIIEFGFLLWSYSSVNSSAREAARYGITVGPGDVAGQRYYDCQGIKDAAMKAGSFAGMEVSDVSIHYDSGPNSANKYDSCEALAAYGGADDIEFGDRIVVWVVHDYKPIAQLMGFSIDPFNMIARSNRTIVKNAEVVSSGSGTGGTGNNPACFTVTTNHVGDGSNPSVSPFNSSGCNITEYLGGETLSLSATPDPGWSIAYWIGTDNDISTATTNTVSMPGGNLEVTVVYVNANPTCHLLSYSQTGTGSGTLARNPISSPGCTLGTYVLGETINLTATADAGSVIKGWTGTLNDGDTTGSNSISMPDSNKAVTVDIDLLSPICHALTIDPHTGEGTDPVPSVANCPGGEYAEGTSVSLNATAAFGYEIASWSGTDYDASTNNYNTVTMDAAKNVTVNYVISVPPDPPSGVYIPNVLPADWKWQNGQKECQLIDLDWSANASWVDAPLYYEVFNNGTSWGNILNGTYWDGNQAVDSTFPIDLGVRAIFTGGVTSVTQYVQYMCRPTELVEVKRYTVQ